MLLSPSKQELGPEDLRFVHEVYRLMHKLSYGSSIEGEDRYLVVAAQILLEDMSPNPPKGV